MQKTEPPLNRFLIIAVLLVFLPLPVLAPYAEYNLSTLPVMNENTLRTYDTSRPQVMAVRSDSGASGDELFKDLTHKALIKCLAKHESSFNQRARGEAGEIGILQFMPETFRIYCEGSIYSAEDQLECADSMLSKDFTNIRHWKATAKFCI